VIMGIAVMMRVAVIMGMRPVVLVRMIVGMVVGMPVTVPIRRIVSHRHSAGGRMRPMAIAAPNPLSMLTTVSPAAQLESIANIGVMPARCAP
jgi:hypothetical protein